MEREGEREKGGGEMMGMWVGMGDGGEGEDGVGMLGRCCTREFLVVYLICCWDEGTNSRGGWRWR